MPAGRIRVSAGFLLSAGDHGTPPDEKKSRIYIRKALDRLSIPAYLRPPKRVTAQD